MVGAKVNPVEKLLTIFGEKPNEIKSSRNKTIHCRFYKQKWVYFSEKAADIFSFLICFLFVIVSVFLDYLFYVVFLINSQSYRLLLFHHNPSRVLLLCSLFNQSVSLSLSPINILPPSPSHITEPLYLQNPLVYLSILVVNTNRRTENKLNLNFSVLFLSRGFGKEFLTDFFGILSTSFCI